MVNGSFVFGMDDDGPDVFERTVEWADRARHRDGHLPHHDAVSRAPRSTTGSRPKAGSSSDDWDRYDTRHAVFQPKRMTAEQLEAGYWRAYRDFYRWGSIVRGAAPPAHAVPVDAPPRLRRRLEEVRADVGRRHPRERVNAMLPLLEGTLDAYGRARRAARTPDGSLDRALDVVVDAASWSRPLGPRS